MARPAAALGLALLPMLLTLLLVRWRMDASISHFVPNYWTDQVGYWHHVASFAEVGFGSGYYSPNEVSPPWEPVRYGVNGPWFAVLFGSVAAITGWSTWTSIPFNGAVLALALLAFARLSNLDYRQLALTGLLVATFWPLLLYVPTSSQESLQQAFAVVLAAVFVRALRSGPGLARREQVLGILFLTGASVTRFSWALLLPCLLLLYARHASRRAVLVAATAGTVAIWGLLRLTALMQHPGHNSVIEALDRVRDKPWSGSLDLFELAWRNTKRLLYPGAIDPTSSTGWSGGALDATGVQSWVIVALLGCMGVVALHRWQGWTAVPRAIAAIPSREAAFHAWNLGTVVVAAVFLYLPNGYYRVLAAHLLLSLVVLAARSRVILVMTAVVLNVVMLPSFVQAYDAWRPNFSLDSRELSEERAAYRRALPYRDDPSTPWCNTILVPIEASDWRMTLIPPGFGISYHVRDYVRGDLNIPHSAYVYLPPQTTPLAGVIRLEDLEPIRASAVGNLYRNPASDCFRSRAASAG